MSDKTKKSSLTDADIKSGRAIGRRAFLLGTLGGTTALAACVPATGITDADGGAYADPVGAGRGGRTGHTGVTDSDGGRYADPVNAGRRTLVAPTATSAAMRIRSDGAAAAERSGGPGWSVCNMRLAVTHALSPSGRRGTRVPNDRLSAKDFGVCLGTASAGALTCGRARRAERG
jgi:hypothetical protein